MLDPVEILTTIAEMLGWGAFVPLIPMAIGVASVISTFYPVEWPGGRLVHAVALILGKARTPITKSCSPG